MSVTETNNREQSETAFTPGPWRVEPNGTSPREDGFNVVGPHGEYLAHLPPITETIPSGNDYQTLHHGEELEARARLIGASPLLFAAVKGLLHDIDTGVLVRDITRDGDPNWSREMVAFVQRLQQAQAAVLAAEGR